MHNAVVFQVIHNIMHTCSWFNHIPITQYHSNSIYSWSGYFCNCTAADQSAADYTLLNSECKKCNRLLIGRNGGVDIMDDYKCKQNSVLLGGHCSKIGSMQASYSVVCHRRQNIANVYHGALVWLEWNSAQLTALTPKSSTLSTAWRKVGSFVLLLLSMLQQIHREQAHKLFAFVSSSGSTETLLGLVIAPLLPELHSWLKLKAAY